VELEPASGHRHDHRWYGHQESEEDEDRVRNRSYTHISTIPVSSDLILPTSQRTHAQQ